MKFTIDKIAGANTDVTFLLDDGTTSTQTIANLPVHDEEALAKVLTEYGLAYQAGLAVEPSAATFDKKLIGKTLDAVELEVL